MSASSHPSVRAMLAVAAVLAAGGCRGARPRAIGEGERPPNLVATPPLAGTLAGRFSTGSNGDAQYRVDIEVPPGIRGVAPSLALLHDSQAGNGVVALAGASAACRRSSAAPRPQPSTVSAAPSPTARATPTASTVSA